MNGNLIKNGTTTRSAPKPAGARGDFTAGVATKTPRVGGALRAPLSERTPPRRDGAGAQLEPRDARRKSGGQAGQPHPADAARDERGVGHVDLLAVEVFDAERAALGRVAHRERRREDRHVPEAVVRHLRRGRAAVSVVVAGLRALRRQRWPEHDWLKSPHFFLEIPTGLGAHEF